MSISISPYLAQALAQTSTPASSDTQAATQAQPAAQASSNPQSPAAGDSVTLSSDAIAKLNKTQIESAMERILEGVKNSTGPKLIFQPAVGAKLDQSC
jgi:hypothetical protein